MEVIMTDVLTTTTGDIIPPNSTTHASCQSSTRCNVEAIYVDPSFAYIASLGSKIVTIQRRSRRSLFKDIPHQCSMTPRKKSLMTKVLRKHDALRKIKIIIKSNSHTLKDLSDYLAISPLLDDFFKDLSSEAVTLMFAHLKNAKKERRWTTEEKCIALFMYHTSPRNYHLLRRMVVLPSLRTLQTKLSRFRFGAGIDHTYVFDHLDHCLRRFTDQDRMCTLMFGEMHLTEHLQYNRMSGLIDGLVDHGKKRRSNSLARSVLVFMAQGIRRKWKQPLAYYFTDGNMSAVQLERFLKDVLDAMQVATLQVVATVCDMNAVYMKVLKSMGSNEKTPYFMYKERKIFTIINPSHLLRATLSNFQKYHVQIPVQIEDANINQLMTAKWEHVRKTYDTDKLNVVLPFLTKIRDVHFQSNPKTEHVAQLMSSSMAACMYTLLCKNDITSPAVATSYFVKQIDELFDSFNGSTRAAPDGKAVRCFLTDESPHLRVWKKAHAYISKWKFIDGAKERKTTRPLPTQISWLHTIKAMMSIWSFCRSQGLSYLRPCSFNQDPLEQLFGVIRGGGAARPTAAHFVGSLKSQILNNLAGLCRGEEDDFDILSNLRNLMTDVPETRDEIDLETNTLMTDAISKDVENVAQTVSRCGIKILSVCHVSGFVVKHLLSQHDCNVCRKCFTSTHPTVISEKVARTVGVAMTLLEINLEKDHTGMVYKEAVIYVGQNANFSWLTCTKHFKYVKRFIIAAVCRISIQWYCTRIGRDAKSKLAFKGVTCNRK